MVPASGRFRSDCSVPRSDDCSHQRREGARRRPAPVWKERERGRNLQAVRVGHGPDFREAAAGMYDPSRQHRRDKDVEDMARIVMERFPIRRIVPVADPGLLGHDNIDEMSEMVGDEGR